MIVVGAGIIGLSCAWFLAKRGIPVTVFDTREAGRESSWAGAGMLAPGGEVETDGEAARMAIRSLAGFPAFVAELRAETGLEIDLRLCGALDVALTEDEAEALERRAAKQATLGIPSENAKHEGALHARFYPKDALVDPRHVTAALHRACERHGTVFHEHEAALEIYEEGGIRTIRGEYHDRGVLVTAGAWSSHLLSSLDVPVPKTMPVRGHLIGYDASPGLLVPILRNHHTYILQRSSGRVVAGSSTEHTGFSRQVDNAIVASIASRAARLLPALRSMHPAETWNGFRPGIERDYPFIGQLTANVWGAFGHYRNGILLAPETARMVSTMIS